MKRTTVKVYLKGQDGKEDSFVTPINLPEDEAIKYYLNRWWNMGIDGDRMMLCYNVEILEDDRSNAEWLFFSLPQKNTQYDTMAKGLKEAIYAAERKQRIVPYDYELEVLQGYLGLPIDLYFEIMINPFTSTLCFTRAQVKSRDLMQLDNGVYI